MLMSLLMVRWDEENKRMFMTWAGHEYLLVYKSKQKKCYKIKSWGLALWMTKNIHKLIKEQEVMFEQDDIIVLYTDWITEAKRKDTDGEWEMYWESALVNSIEKAPEINVWNRTTKTAKSVFNNITIELSKFLGYKHTQHDDITLTVIHYKWEWEIQDNLPEPENIEDTFITEWSWK
jgi:serine phosphatase RsbU (regulator of sigma subunit)